MFDKQLKLLKEAYEIEESINDANLFKAVILAGGPGCFVGGTLVRTKDGHKPIEEVEVGELVFTINEETGDEEWKPVMNTYTYSEHDESLLEITFDNGEVIVCTENHLFYVDGEWIPAKNM